MRHILPRVVVVLCWLGCPGPGQAPEATSTDDVVTAEGAGLRFSGPGAPTPADRREFEVQRKEIFQALRTRVGQLQEAGTYSCCIKSPCSHCALMAGGCGCREGLLRGEPVCHECGLMWARGQGDVDGVDPADVRTFLEAEKGMAQPAAPCACSEEAGG